MTFAPLPPCWPAQVGRHGQPIDRDRRFALLAVFVTLLTVLGACAQITGGQHAVAIAADSAIGPAPTREARICRTGILFGGVATVAANQLDRSNSQQAAAAALVQFDNITQALRAARDPNSIFLETQLASARGLLEIAVGSTLKDRIVGLFASRVINADTVVAGILEASTGAAVIADAASAMQAFTDGTLTLDKCNEAVDHQIDLQRARVQKVARVSLARST